MKESVKEWIVPVAIVLVIAIAYFYHQYPKEAQQVTQQFQDKPYVSYRDNKLYIDEFTYTIGITGYNKVGGDFENLNIKVYKLLKGKSGTCDVYLLIKHTDKYGKETSNYDLKGTLDIDELNKYTTEEFWQKSGGIEQLILNGTQEKKEPVTNYNPADTAVVESQATQPQNTERADSTFVRYDFNKMNYKPWSYYKIDGKSLTLIAPNEPGINEAINYWETFISDILDIQVSCSQHYADLIITTKKGESRFTLNLKVKNTYVLSGNPSMAIEINPDHCEVFFMNGNNCVSVDSKSLEPVN